MAGGVTLEVQYKSNKLEKQCTNRKEAVKKFGDRNAKSIFQRIQEIKSVDSVDTLVQFNIGRCHPLVGDRKGQYSMHLVHPYRLIFEEINGAIKIARIMEIVDYH